MLARTPLSPPSTQGDSVRQTGSIFITRNDVADSPWVVGVLVFTLVLTVVVIDAIYRQTNSNKPEQAVAWVLIFRIHGLGATVGGLLAG
jgi:hypothetical protein